MLGWFFLSRRPRGVPSQVGGVTKTLQILPPPPCSTACLATHPASCHPGPPGLTQCSLINVVKMFLQKSFVFPVDLILLPTEAVPGLLLDLKGEPSVATEVKVGDLSGALYKTKKKCLDRDKIRVDLQAHKFMALPSLDQVPWSGSVPPPCLKDRNILIHGGIGRVEQNSYILLLPLTLDPPQLSRSYESSEGSFFQAFRLDFNLLKILKI